MIPQRVAATFTTPSYNSTPPYHPHERYPENPIPGVSATANPAYAGVRQIFVDLRRDLANHGTPAWNPLGGTVKPGQTVLLLPNFVLGHNASGDDLFAVITHPSVLRALVDLVYIALEGKGRIVIASAPQMDCDWTELQAAVRLASIQELYRRERGFEVEFYDLRNFALKDRRVPAYSSNRIRLPGDPAGSVVVDLGRESLLYGLENDNFYGADYDRSVTRQHHEGERQEYCVSKTILSADVVISVPKMKVHKKVGVTLNFKGLVGINTDKNYLVHYRVGTPRDGGDQMPDAVPTSDKLLLKTQRWFFDKALARGTAAGDLAYRVALRGYRTFLKPLVKVNRNTVQQDAGNWYGNDSAWRMTADLARIIHLADRDGKLHATAQRAFFSVIDGIVGGEGDGPLMPHARRAGCLVGGENLCAVDLVTSRLMGFDVRQLKTFSPAFEGKWPFAPTSLDEIDTSLDGVCITGARFFDPKSLDPLLAFEPHPGWRGHLEVARAQRDA